MISIAPQAGFPRIYNGALYLIFVILGLKSNAIKPNRKFLLVSLCIVSYIAALLSKGGLSYIFAVSGNAFTCTFAGFGIDAMLSANSEFGFKLNKIAKSLFVILAPVLFALLIYFYGNKILFFSVVIFFNAASLGLLFILYLSYLTGRAAELKERVFTRLSIMVVLETLTISMYQSPWFLKNLFK